MSRYKWIAFTQAQLARLLEIVERHCQNSEGNEAELCFDITIYKKIKKIKERKEDDSPFIKIKAVFGDP